MEMYVEVDDDNITDLIDNDFARLDTVDEIGCRVDDPRGEHLTIFIGRQMN